MIGDAFSPPPLFSSAVRKPSVRPSAHARSCEVHLVHVCFVVQCCGRVGDLYLRLGELEGRDRKIGSRIIVKRKSLASTAVPPRPTFPRPICSRLTSRTRAVMASSPPPPPYLRSLRAACFTIQHDDDRRGHCLSVSVCLSVRVASTAAPPVFSFLRRN